jgi:hypothetical protein
MSEHPERLLMEALEVVPKQATEEELFSAWGRIIHDPEVLRLTGVLGSRIKRTGEPPNLKVEFIPEKSVADVVVAMTVADRRALRARVFRHGAPR